jgi:hypothetical protein
MLLYAMLYTVLLFGIVGQVLLYRINMSSLVNGCVSSGRLNSSSGQFPKLYLSTHTYINLRTYVYKYSYIILTHKLTYTKYITTIMYFSHTYIHACTHIYTYSVSLTWTAVREWRCFCHHPIIECPSAYCRTLTADPSESIYIHTYIYIHIHTYIHTYMILQGFS